MRFTRSPCVPSFSWKTILSSFATRCSSGILRSLSQKNFASDSRAATTRSLPATMATPPSRATIFETRMKFGARRPPSPSERGSVRSAGVRGCDAARVWFPSPGRSATTLSLWERVCALSTKHFWFTRIVARMTSGGIARNAGSNDPISTRGHSTRPPTSSSSFSSSIRFEAAREGEVFRVVQIDVASPRRIDDDFRLLRARHVIVEAPDLYRAGSHEAVAIGDIAGGDAVDREGHDVRLLVFRAKSRDDGMQRAHPAQRIAARRRQRPSACSSATESS